MRLTGSTNQAQDQQSTINNSIAVIQGWPIRNTKKKKIEIPISIATKAVTRLEIGLTKRVMGDRFKHSCESLPLVWMCILYPRFICWNWITNVMVSEVGSQGGDHNFYKKPQELPGPCTVERHIQSRKPSPDTNPTSSVVTVVFPASRTVRNTFLLLSRTYLMVVCYTKQP